MSTTVKVGSAVVGTAVDVTRAGVRAVTSDSADDGDDNKDSDSITEDASSSKQNR